MNFINAFCLLLAISAVATVRSEAKLEHRGAFYEAPAAATPINVNNDVVSRWAAGSAADFTVKRVSSKSIAPPDRKKNTSYFMKHVWKYIGADK